MSLQCNQCDEKFATNFSLYQHKTNNHGPAIAITLPQPQKLNQVSENPSRFKRLRNDDNVGNPKKYRRVIEGEQDVPDAQVTSLKRPLADGADNSGSPGLTPASKYQKIEARGKKRKPRSPLTSRAKRSRIETMGTKRYHGSDSESEQPAKYSRIEERGDKRLRSSSSSHDSDDYQPTKYQHVAKYGTKRGRAPQSDESGEPSCKKRHIAEQGEKRYRSNSSSDDDSSSKYRRISQQEMQRDRLTLIERLKKEIEKWRRLYRREKTRNTNIQKECEEKINYLDGQLKEIKEFDGDYELNNLSKVVINSVTIDDFNKIRELVSQNGLNSVLRSKKYLMSLQKLFLGLSYGIVPITTSQRVALSHDEKELVKKLENARSDQIRSHIKINKQSFLKLFSVINESIKFVVKAYNRYGN